jgi:hypothetical protein
MPTKAAVVLRNAGARLEHVCAMDILAWWSTSEIQIYAMDPKREIRTRDLHPNGRACVSITGGGEPHIKGLKCSQQDTPLPLVSQHSGSSLKS